MISQPQANIDVNPKNAHIDMNPTFPKFHAYQIWLATNCIIKPVLPERFGEFAKHFVLYLIHFFFVYFAIFWETNKR